MAVSNVPTFTQAPRFTQAQLVNSNNPNRDGVTGLYSAALGVGANGALITAIYFQAITTTVAGLLRLFYSPDSGTTWRELTEIVTLAVTVSGTVGGDSHLYLPSFKLVVPSTAQFKFNFQNNTETWNMFLAAEDY